MPLPSYTPFNVDDDDDIKNTKPAATEPNDGMVDRTPSSTLNVAPPVTLSPNDCFVEERNQSPSSRIYRPFEIAPDSPTDSSMVMQCFTGFMALTMSANLFITTMIKD